MTERKGTKSELIGDGTVLIAKEDAPLSAGETRNFGPFDTHSVSNLGGDILADQGCTLTVIPVPSEGVEGEPSDPLIVSANVAARWTYSQVFSPQVLLRVVNTSGADMASFLLCARGDA